MARMTEVPGTFGIRHSGVSKAGIGDGLTYPSRIIKLRADIGPRNPQPTVNRRPVPGVPVSADKRHR